MNRIKALQVAAIAIAQIAAAEPKTLLEMGNSKIPFDPKAAALVLIDYQQEYTEGKLPLYEVERAISETRRLLLWAREKRLPIIHVLHQGNTGSIFDPATKASKVIPELAPMENESVIYKLRPNGFAGTELKETLKKRKVSSIVFAGLMSHMCLDATVRASFDEGFHSVVVASTTTTRDLPGVNGTPLKAADLTAATLASLQDLVAAVDKDLNELQLRFK